MRAVVSTQKQNILLSGRTGKVSTFGENKQLIFQCIFFSVVVESMSKSAFLDMLKSSSEKPKSKDQPNMKVCGLNKTTMHVLN